MFTRLTRFASMPLQLTNGVTRLLDGQTAPKVVQTEDGGAAALPAVPPPVTGSWKEEITSDPFLGSTFPREEFSELAGMDFGGWDTPEAHLPWYERPMVFVDHVQMTPTRTTSRNEVSLFNDFENLGIGSPFDCFDKWPPPPTFFDDLDLDLKTEPLDDFYDVKPVLCQHIKVKPEPIDEGYPTVCAEFLQTPVKEEPPDLDFEPNPTFNAPRCVRTNTTYMATYIVSQAVPAKHSSSKNVYRSSSTIGPSNQPRDNNSTPWCPDTAFRKRPARNCKRRSALELLKADNFHPAVIKSEEVDLKPDIDPSTFVKIRGVRYKPCANEAESRVRAMNRISAKKYRTKKRLEKLALAKERSALEIKNADLHMEVEFLQRDVAEFRRRLGL